MITHHKVAFVAVDDMLFHVFDGQISPLFEHRSAAAHLSSAALPDFEDMWSELVRGGTPVDLMPFRPLIKALYLGTFIQRPDYDTLTLENVQQLESKELVVVLATSDGPQKRHWAVLLVRHAGQVKLALREVSDTMLSTFVDLRAKGPSLDGVKGVLADLGLIDKFDQLLSMIDNIPDWLLRATPYALWFQTESDSGVLPPDLDQD